ncbi:hypothetical protein [Halobacterium jilantaiense]|uniref:DUF7993 domain-containing protein n=1 Tax=Halobacterium jilantaiense TaxID=355548 RepID=A0A1I0QAZ4_9EURY|nr:hypothetical protein [Halobacterium jilantaiense]SEW23752.1 hypothetical protein SAMN04487945_2412 [Halobacterium jilantaiense]
MVEDRITDGKRIAELLSSEVTGHERSPYDELGVADANPDVEPTADGARAYDVEHGGERLARVFVQPDRVRLELYAGLDAARDAAEDAELRTRPVASEPPRVVVFVEYGAAAKRALDVLGDAAAARDD